MFTESITYPASFVAGLLSFFSPCILPLIPGYFTFITGFSLDELTDKGNAHIRKRVIGSTLLYVAGFSTVFILLGASATYIGRFIFQYGNILRIAGGIFIILLGIHITGLIRFKQLDFEKRVNFSAKPLHFLGAFVVGMAFAAGWTPCIGPILGSILIVAGEQESVGQGALLLGIYSAGLALPFLILSVFINYVLKFLSNASRILKYINYITGVLLIMLGVLLITGKIIF
ncbi:MAG: cytochrome c biogenesis protein CcdA [Desulfobacterales bacterium]|nr:cytochrome c biogenesis protein CcdA [Desulfobacterales bacterium]